VVGFFNKEVTLSLTALKKRIVKEIEESGNGPWRMITGHYAYPIRV